jgi:hypothetical protein
MADGENKIKKWIKKWQKDKGDIGAEEENPQITGPRKTFENQRIKEISGQKRTPNHRAGGKPSRISG